MPAMTAAAALISCKDPELEENEEITAVVLLAVKAGLFMLVDVVLAAAVIAPVE